MWYSKLILAALLVAVSGEEVNPPPYPDGVPHQVGGKPVTVDAGDFAQVDVQPHGGPVRVDAPFTKLHVDRQTGDVNLRAGPVALDVDTAKGGKPFGLFLDIPKIFNLRIGHPADGGQGVNVDLPILRGVSEFLRRMQESVNRQPFPPAVLPPEEVEVHVGPTKRKGTTEAPPAKDANQENLI